MGAHKPRMSDTEREALKAEVKMPCVYKSEEDLEVEWYIHRGHRLSEQDEMPQLCAEIKQFDTMLAVTTGGRPIAELLTRSARHRILSPLEQAIETQSPSATSDGFRDIEQFAAELSDDYAFHLLMCYAHIDAVRLCKTQKAKDSGLFGCRTIESHISKASTHITFATKHNAQSAAIAAAKCALCEISNASPVSLMQTYEELIALDKTTYAHFRKYARALLAHPEIGLDVLDQEASKMVKKLRISGEQAPTRGCIWIPWVRIVLRLNVWTSHVLWKVPWTYSKDVQTSITQIFLPVLRHYPFPPLFQERKAPHNGETDCSFMKLQIGL